MSGADGSGWRPLTKPEDDGRIPAPGSPGASGASRLTASGRLIGSGFGRLARVHALVVSSDALVAVALAGSLFFSIPTGEARGRVALYLLLTMAPFAIVAPIIGPALDRLRSGPRWMVIATAAGRVVVCAFMVGDLDGLLLFPEAFLFLVLSKTYQVAKSALVPAVVTADDDLVEANSRLQLIAGIAGFVAALPALALNEWVGPEATLILAAAVSGVAVFAGTRLPNERIEPGPEAPAALAELQRTGIVLGGSAMGVLRGIVGFLTFLLAFDLRGGGDDGPIPVGLALGRAVRVTAGFDPAGTGAPAGARHGTSGWSSRSRSSVAWPGRSWPRSSAGWPPRNGSSRDRSWSPGWPRCWPPRGAVCSGRPCSPWRSRPRPPQESRPSTRSCSATPPTPIGAIPSPASKPDFRSSGSSEPFCR